MPDLDEFDDNDPELLAAAVGAVRRLHAEDAPAPPRPRPLARSRRADERAALEESRRQPLAAVAAGDGSRYRRADVAERILRRLQRGLYAVEDELDLHGLDGNGAEALLRRFLQEARDAEHRCLRVITGKGLHSKDDEPVLRPRVEAMLRQRADVLAYASAPPAQGGTGALLILLARRRGS
jgi:DNA-nicking Smr family endonuclease